MRRPPRPKPAPLFDQPAEVYPAPLYDGRPPAEPVETSREAAEAITPASGSLRRHVLALFQTWPYGLTSDDVEVKLGLRHQTASARVRELVLLGFCRVTSQRRKTRSGRNAFVVVATGKAGAP